jgi:hypothetical protein
MGQQNDRLRAFRRSGCFFEIPGWFASRISIRNVERRVDREMLARGETRAWQRHACAPGLGRFPLVRH